LPPVPTCKDNDIVTFPDSLCSHGSRVLPGPERQSS
jgi:hypothetical protein